jgi:hypothetical protein
MRLNCVIDTFASLLAWVIQRVCGGTLRDWSDGGWRRRDCSSGGVSQSEVARRLGVHRQSVIRRASWRSPELRA